MKRFSRIRYAMQKLEASGGAIDQYKLYLAGTNKITREPFPEGTKLTKTPRAVNPFGIPLDAKSNYQVQVSDRAIAGIGETGVALTDLNVLTVGGTGVTTEDVPDFRPAQAIIRVPGTTVATKTSGITKMKYKTKGGTSYTYPFGKKADTDTVKSIGSAITAKVTEDSAKNRSISFKPEKII